MITSGDQWSSNLQTLFQSACLSMQPTVILTRRAVPAASGRRHRLRVSFTLMWFCCIIFRHRCWRSAFTVVCCCYQHHRFPSLQLCSWCELRWTVTTCLWPQTGSWATQSLPLIQEIRGALFDHDFTLKKQTHQLIFTASIQSWGPSLDRWPLTTWPQSKCLPWFWQLVWLKVKYDSKRVTSGSGVKLLLTRLKSRTKSGEHFNWRTTGGRSQTRLLQMRHLVGSSTGSANNC